MVTADKSLLMLQIFHLTLSITVSLA